MYPYRFFLLLSFILCAARCLLAEERPLAPLVQPFIDHNIIGGAVVAIADKDKVIDLEAFGYEDVASKVAMQPDALFWLASMTKSMTCSCLMMLVDEKKVGLDDPIAKYLPEFKEMRVSKIPPKGDSSEDGGAGAAIEKRDKNAPPAETVPAESPITVREVMSHTAGLPGRSTIESNPLDRHPLDVAVKSYASDPLLCQPGTAFHYSNEGIHVAGRIIEVVSGMPYEQFLQTRLWNPLGMKDTTFFPTPEQVKRLAKSYLIGDETHPVQVHPIEQLAADLSDRTHRYVVPAGGVFSTAADLVAFTQFILNDGVHNGARLLSAESVHAMTTKETPPAVRNGYGFGWYTSDDGIFRHGGAFKTEMCIDPKKGVISILLEQVAGGKGWPVDHKVDLRKALLTQAQAMKK